MTMCGTVKTDSLDKLPDILGMRKLKVVSANPDRPKMFVDMVERPPSLYQEEEYGTVIKREGQWSKHPVSFIYCSFPCNLRGKPKIRLVFFTGAVGTEFDLPPVAKVIRMKPPRNVLGSKWAVLDVSDKMLMLSSTITRVTLHRTCQIPNAGSLVCSLCHIQPFMKMSWKRVNLFSVMLLTGKLPNRNENTTFAAQRRQLIIIIDTQWMCAYHVWIDVIKWTWHGFSYHVRANLHRAV